MPAGKGRGGRELWGRIRKQAAAPRTRYARLDALPRVALRYTHGNTIPSRRRRFCCAVIVRLFRVGQG